MAEKPVRDFTTGPETTLAELLERNPNAILSGKSRQP